MTSLPAVTLHDMTFHDMPPPVAFHDKPASAAHAHDAGNHVLQLPVYGVHAGTLQEQK